MRVKDERKIEVIYQATLQLTQEVGIAGITVAKIAKQANLATGTVYIYFKNKEELINQLYLHLKQQTTQDLFQGVNLQEPFKVCFKKLWINSLQNKINNFKESVFMEQYYHSPYITVETRQMAFNQIQPFMELLERGKKELVIKPIDNALLMAITYGFIRQLSYAHIEQKLTLSQDTIETAFQMNWDALKA